MNACFVPYPLFMKVMDFLFPRRRNHVVSDSAPPSFLRSLMASTYANAAAVLQMLEDESHDNRRRSRTFLIKGSEGAERPPPPSVAQRSGIQPIGTKLVVVSRPRLLRWGRCLCTLWIHDDCGDVFSS